MQRWTLLLGVAVAAAVGPGLLVSEPVGAEPSDVIAPCETDDPPDWCLDAVAEPEPSPGAGEGSGSGGGGSSEDDESCGWEPVDLAELDTNASNLVSARWANGRPPDDVEVTFFGFCGSFTPLMWVPVDDAPEVTAHDAADGLYERIHGQMPELQVATSPPAGTDAVIGTPVFVTVDNWVDELAVTESLGGATVTVTATPSMSFDPGVPGVTPVSCAGPGRAYDPAQGDLWDQAAEADACAHAYERRTGVEGRGEAWPSTVSVTWSISWSATTGESGTFPDVVRSADIPRGVVEVQALVIGD